MLAQAYGAQGKTLNALYNKVQGLNHSGQYAKALELLSGQSSVVHADQSSYLNASVEALNQQIVKAKQRLDDFKL
jgi:predicted Zn-dependent protease